MNLSKLTIHGFRAFPPEEKTFDFNEKNVAVLGDNGTGKSSILAAIEFLLSGNLTHLSGEGTNGLSLREHVPHQDATPEECYVEGTFQSSDGRIGTFQRKASDSTELESVSGDIDADSINISQWNDDHLILTRGELLEFIEATARTRGNELSKLLNLNGVSNRTQGFEQIRGRVDQEVEETERKCTSQVTDIASSLDIDLQYPINSTDKEIIVDEINEKLILLQVGEIDSLNNFGSAMESIELEVAGDLQDTFYQSSAQNRTEDCISQLEQFSEVEEKFGLLSDLLSELKSRDTKLLDEMDFFETAERLVETQTTECPLCGEVHEEDYLDERIQRRLERLSEIEELREEIQELGEEVRNRLGDYRAICSELTEKFDEGIEVGDHDSTEDNVGKLRQFAEDLEAVEDTVSSPLISHDDSGTLAITDFESPTFDLDEVLSSLRSISEYMDALDPRDKYTNAHADLVRVQDAWERLCEHEPQLSELRSLEEELEEVTNLFAEAREESLADLYSSIESNFNEYYTTINPDEEEINLTLDYDGTDSVDIEAKHGEQRDSPLAYHSEGHIDTMGICLFLALREELDTSGPDIVLLDDIVMSIDKNHRRGVARLLADYFDDDTQAVLATHDEVWCDQLQGHGIVSSNNAIEIADWELSTGPVMTWGNWDMIQERLDDGDPHAAAAHLRRTAEKVGRILALKLQVSMQFKERYSLGDYIHAINSRMKEVASRAKGHHPDGSEFWETAKEIDDKRKDLWGDLPLNELNRMIHYNRDEWGQLTSEDLQDVLDTWEKIDRVITCDECENWVSYSRDGDYRWIQCGCRNIQFGYEK